MRESNMEVFEKTVFATLQNCENQSTAPERIRGILQEVFRKMLYFQIHFIVSIPKATMTFAFLQNNFLFFA